MSSRANQQPIEGVSTWLTRDPLPGAELNQGPNLYWYANNDPINGLDPLGLGTWAVTSMNIVGTNAQDTHGFQVSFSPSKSDSDLASKQCGGGKIVLYQIIGATGLDGPETAVDMFPDTTTIGSKVFPHAMTPVGQTPYSYIDSPGSADNYLISTWHITAAAVVRSKCGDTLLGTYYFQFGNRNRSLAIDPKTVNDRQEYNEGMDGFNKMYNPTQK